MYEYLCSILVLPLFYIYICYIVTNRNEENSTQSIFKDVDILSPATIVGPLSNPTIEVIVPKASKQIISSIDAETVQRERGNEDFKNGNYAGAIKAYTICLGMKSKNTIAFSNRAYAYLKLKEYAKAEADCTFALNIDKTHVKSLVRRASARNSLGKHRAALVDLMSAQEVDPSASFIRVDINKTKELLRSAVNRAPFVDVSVVWEEGQAQAVQGPVMSA